MKAESFGVLVAALLLGCSGSPTSYSNGGGGGGGGGGGASASVTIQDYKFGPDTVTIKGGGTVTWTNTSPHGHTVTSDAGSFNSGTLAPPGTDAYGGMTSGATYQMTFATPGTYAYHCTIHSSMHAAVVVQ